MNSFRCDGLSKSFDGIHALTELQVQFSSSGITAIIGPNGAGKTTLLNVLTGFVQPDAGRCFLGDLDITHLPPYRIAQLGVARTFQDLRLISRMSVLENVMVCRPKQRGESLLGALFRYGVGSEEASNKEEAMELLHFAELEGKALDLAGQLSYGQQKLLTLACCLATEPRILLLDEPVAGIHPEMAFKIVHLLRQLRDQGKIIVFIEHDIGAVREVADHLIVMDDGRIIADGPPREILDRAEIMEAFLD